jgi:hypothetical protein
MSNIPYKYEYTNAAKNIPRITKKILKTWDCISYDMPKNPTKANYHHQCSLKSINNTKDIINTK